MLQSMTRWRAVTLGALLAATVLGTSFAQQASQVGKPLTTTALDTPRGLTMLAGGDVLVAEAGGGRVLRVSPDGTQTEVLTGLPTTGTVIDGTVETVGVSAAIQDANGGYRYILGQSATAGYSSLYTATFSGSITLLADLGAYEELKNTDGKLDAQGNPEVLSNPYDLAFDGVGGVYVSDAGANAVLRVDAVGAIRPFAIFQPIGSPAIDQTPSGITVGPDGALYVAMLTAPPFPQGEARVYRLKDQNADGDALDDGESTVFATGLTAATDVVFDSDGSLLVSQYSTDMATGALGRISRIVDGVPVSVVHLLTTPRGITITEAGRLLVSEESLGVVTDVTDAPVGGFSAPIATGVTLTVYGGGPVEQLSLEAADEGATTVAITSGGAFIVLVPGAPSFVNKAFTDRFPFTVPAGTLLLVLSP
jgi:hypothetical protein